MNPRLWNLSRQDQSYNDGRFNTRNVYINYGRIRQGYSLYGLIYSFIG